MVGRGGGRPSSIWERFVCKQRYPEPIQDSQGEGSRLWTWGSDMGWIHQHVLEPLDGIRELGSAPSQGQGEGEKVPRRLRGPGERRKSKVKVS